MGKNRCPECGSPVNLKEGIYGLFFGCSNFPKCRFTASHWVMELEDDWDIDKYEQYQLNRELDAIVMESEHGDWGCRDED